MRPAVRGGSGYTYEIRSLWKAGRSTRRHLEDGGGKYPIRYGGEQIASMGALAESRFYKDVHRRVQKVQEPEKVKQRIFVSPPLVQGKKSLSP